MQDAKEVVAKIRKQGIVGFLFTRDAAIALLEADREAVRKECAERAVNYLEENFVAWEAVIMQKYKDEMRAAVLKDTQ